MSQLMDQVIERLRAVPEAQQDQVARLVMSDLDDDERWAESTERHSVAVQRLTARVLADHTAGHSQPLDPDRL